MYSRSEKNTILIMAIIGSFFPGFLMTGLNVAIPEVSVELNMSAVMLPWITNAFSLSTGMVLLPFGKVADMYGRKKVLLLGAVIFTLASLAVPLASSGIWIIIIRAFHGVGAAMLGVTSIAILATVFPEAERGKALGIATAALYAGLSMGPFIGGVLTESLGWRSIFLLTAVFGVSLIVLVKWKVKREWSVPGQGKFDFSGSAIYAAAILVLTYGLSLLPGINSLWFIMGSLAVFGGFAYQETRTNNPILQVRLLQQNAYYTLSNITSMITYSATLSASFMLSLYLQFTRGLTPIQAGLILIVSPAIQAALSPTTGRLSDRFKPRTLVSMGLALNGAALGLFALLGQNSLLGILFVGLVLMGFGFALFNSPNTNAIMSSVPRRYHGEASAMASVMRMFGGLISVSLATLLIALFIGNVQITPEYYPGFIRSMHWLFAISAIFCLIGVGLSLARGEQKIVEIEAER